MGRPLTRGRRGALIPRTAEPRVPSRAPRISSPRHSRRTMRRVLTLLAVTGLLMAAVPTSLAHSPRSDLRVGPMMGVIPSKGYARPGGGGNANLIYHNGAIMSAGAAVTPIFWGPTWSGTTYPKDLVSGLQN